LASVVRNPDRHATASRLADRRARLRKRIGRHDGHRRIGGAVRRQRRPGRRHAGPHLFEVERHADDAGRRDEHEFVAHTEGIGGRGGHALGHGHAGVTRAGVGAAAVDDRARAQAAGARQVFTRHDDRRRDGKIGRKDRGRGHRSASRGNQAQIERPGMAGFFDATVHARGGEPARGRDSAIGQKGQRRRHGQATCVVVVRVAGR
jgi:hypothetical protein